MPEGVEVCLISLFLNEKLKNKMITNMEILGGRYSRHPLKGKDLFNNLPLKIIKVDSKGKFLWFELEGGIYILNTFGLEGMWSLKRNKHSGIKLEINNGEFDIYFSDSRNFGTFEITDKKSVLDKKLDELAMDLLKTDFCINELHENIKLYTRNNRRKENPIVKVLLEQKKKSGIGSGIGNYLVAEILYHSRISPHTKMIKFVQDKQLTAKLGESIKYVIKLSFMTSTIGYIAKMETSIRTFIEQLRIKTNENIDHENNYHKNIDLGDDIFKFKVYRQKTDPCGYRIKGEKIIKTRTTYWVEEIQI